jgi:hypothetical protein
MGAGTGVKVKLSNVNEEPVSVKTALVMPKSEILRKIFGGRPVPAPIKFAPPVDTDPTIVAPLKTVSVIEVFPVTKAPTDVTGVVKVAVMVPLTKSVITLGLLLDHASEYVGIADGTDGFWAVSHVCAKGLRSFERSIKSLKLFRRPNRAPIALLV